MKEIILWESLLHLKEAFHDLFTLWIEKSWILSDGVEEMSHGLNSFGSDHDFLLSVSSNDGDDFFKSWHESRIESIK